MFNKCRAHLRLVLMLICCGAVAAGDDDVEQPDLRAPNPAQLQKADAAAFTLLNRNASQEFVETELRYKVDDFRAKYDLSIQQQAKLTLACRADVRRVSQDLNQVRHAATFREVQSNLFGRNSFMAKSLPNIFTPAQTSKYLADVDERSRLHHRSNIEGVIREFERHIVLQIPQQEALVKLMLCEIRPPKPESDLNPLVLRYQLSRLPEDALIPLFDDDQWPTVKKVVDGYGQLGPTLARSGIVIDAAEMAKTPVDSDGGAPVKTGEE